MKVYQQIGAVAKRIAQHGVGKNGQNQEQGYAFRSNDDVMNALSPMLADAGLLILPRVLTRTVVERETKRGGAMFNVVVEVEFDIVCVEDGSKHTVKTFGEGSDSSDKATNKAQTAAYKYMAVQTFCIPTRGVLDEGDQTTPEATRPAARASAPARQASAPPANRPVGPFEVKDAVVVDLFSDKKPYGVVVENEQGQRTKGTTFSESVLGKARRALNTKECVVARFERIEKGGKFYCNIVGIDEPLPDTPLTNVHSIGAVNTPTPDPVDIPADDIPF